jgi:hypothetical protein
MYNDLINKSKRFMSRQSSSWTGTSGNQLSVGQTEIMRTASPTDTVVDVLSEQWVAPTDAATPFTVTGYGVGRSDPSLATTQQNTDQHRSLKSAIRETVETRGLPASRQHPSSLIEAAVASISRGNRATFTGAQIDEQDAMKTKQNGMLKHNDTPFTSVVNKTAEILRGRRGSKTLKPNRRGYAQSGGDAAKFVSVHDVERHDDRVGNDDKLFQASNRKTFGRRNNRFGYSKDDQESKYFAPDRSKMKPGVATEQTVVKRQETVSEMWARRQEESRLRQKQRHKAMCFGTEKELRDKIIESEMPDDAMSEVLLYSGVHTERIADRMRNEDLSVDEIIDDEVQRFKEFQASMPLTESVSSDGRGLLCDGWPVK